MAQGYQPLNDKLFRPAEQKLPLFRLSYRTAGKILSDWGIPRNTRSSSDLQDH
jgi:hypothetical protein